MHMPLFSLVLLPIPILWKIQALIILPSVCFVLPCLICFSVVVMWCLLFGGTASFVLFETTDAQLFSYIVQDGVFFIAV